MSGSYRVAPLFVIRLAGGPFDRLAALGTTRSSTLARQLLVRQEQLAAARAEAERFVGSRESGLTADESRAFRAALRDPLHAADVPAQAAAVVEIARDVEIIDQQLRETIELELQTARTELLEASRAILPDYLVFAAGEFGERAAELFGSEQTELPPRNSRVRERERHLLLYLQRVCAKNDTYSAFGPSSWGRIEATKVPLQIECAGGVAQRDVFFERWVAHILVGAINADPEALPEFRPRPNPNGRITADGFYLADRDRVVPLDEPARELLARCNGEIAIHSLGQDELIRSLVENSALLARMEVAPVDPHAFDALLVDVKRWRDTPLRARWLSVIEPLAALKTEFASEYDAAARAEVMGDARHRLRELGGARAWGQRSLYAAKNPIAEDCVRNCDFVLNEKMAEQLARDAAPWFDLWRDCYAFVATRVAAGLRKFLETAPRREGVVTLPGFLAHCAAQKMPLTGHGIVALAHIAFQEVKQAFRQTMSERADAEEIEFTADDAQLIRRSFQFVPFDQYTYPSADVQMAAASVDDVNRGNYEWILSELHPPIALLQHAVLWGCPDIDSLGQALRSTTCDHPTFHYGFFAADFTAHTTVRQMEVPRGGMFFITPERPRPDWPYVAPAEAEVFVDETGDVGLRELGSKRYLGSFARGWVIPLGFHPFYIDRPPHMPRLRCGKVIVQRQSWTVGASEFAGDNIVIATERLRTARSLPRFIYIRPTEQALRRSGAEGRDKDTKPVFIDLESYLSLEIFQRWLRKAGELEVTEMSPRPDQLLWREGDGRHTFELRMQIVPQ